MTYNIVKGYRCSNTDHTAVGNQYYTHYDINNAYRNLERLHNKWDCGCIPDIMAVKDV